jgi:hypothetical protein
MSSPKYRKKKQVHPELEASQTKAQELQSLLQSLLQPATLQHMASSCVEQAMIEEETRTTTKSSWWQTRPRRRLPDDSLEERMLQVLKDELEGLIGEKALTEDQRQQKAIEHAWQESKSKVEAMNENPELLLQAFFEEEEKDYKNKKERRVFSM